MDKETFLRKFQKSKVEEFPNQVTKSPKVSVLIQTYQHGNFIKECLNSVLQQETDFEFEILLGEDNSTDETREICINYTKNYPEKIKLFLHNNDNKIIINGNNTGNFNVLYNFFHANGKYLAFCEGDDYWNDPFKLQKQVDFLEANKNYFSNYHLFQVKGISNNLINSNFFLAQPNVDLTGQELQIMKFHPHISTICFENIFRELPLQVANVINIDSFILSILGNYGNMKFLDNINPSIYRQHKGGVWSNQMKDFKFEAKIILYSNLEEYYKTVDEHKLTNLFKKRKKEIKKMHLLYFLRTGKVFKSPFNFIRLLIQTLE